MNKEFHFEAAKEIQKAIVIEIPGTAYLEMILRKKYGRRVSFKTAVKVLKLARKRGGLMAEILRTAEAFGYDIIVKKIRESDCMKMIIEHEMEIEEFEEEMQ